MSTLPEHDPNQDPLNSTVPAEELTTLNGADFSPYISAHESALALDPEINFPEYPEPPLFQSWYQPQLPPPVRIPHLGHLFLLIVLSILGWIAASLLALLALHFHLFGVSTLQQATGDIRYTLGLQVAAYIFGFGACLVVFPMVWHKGFFAGLQWNGATALRLRWPLFAAAGVCFVIALIDEVLLPGPEHAPIEELFKTSTSAWMLFAFGVTFAPFFEEMAFRGFLLPSLCTAWDWTVEKYTGKPAPPLGEHSHPQWSIPAMVAGSILTSIPFALMHAEQTAHAVSVFLLLVCVSLVLCGARLAARSLAASVLVHASYNFLLFSLMLLGTSGFKHLDKM
jgi:uncharacterized protein